MTRVQDKGRTPCCREGRMVPRCEWRADRESPGEVYVRKARESGNRGAEHLRSTQLTLGIATLDYFYIKWDSSLFLHLYSLQSTLLLFPHWGPR
jgi:hypothetical protein